MTPQTPAIRHRVPVGLSHERPAPHQEQAHRRFRGQKEHLEHSEQKEGQLAVFQNHEQGVSVGVKPFGLARPQLDHLVAPLWIDRGGEPVMQAGRGRGDRTASGNPDPPGQIQLVGVHEEGRIKFAEAVEELTFDQVGTPRGHEQIPAALIVGGEADQPEDVVTVAPDRLDAVVAVIQHQRSGGVGPAGLHLRDEASQAVGFEPGVVVQEKKIAALSRARRAVVAFAIAQVFAVLNETTVAPGTQQPFGQFIRSIGRAVIRDDDFNSPEDRLRLQRRQAALDPAGAVVIQDHHTDERSGARIIHGDGPSQRERVRRAISHGAASPRAGAL